MNTFTSFFNKKAGQIALAQFLLAFFFFSVLPFGVAAQTYSGPLVITKGGTYTGNWESRDSEVSAVEVMTSEPVVIENANIRGAGRLIRSAGYRANITVRNTNGYGITPTPWRDYKKPRNFLAVDEFTNIVVENCYIEGAAGINLGGRYLGDGSERQTVRIRYNKVSNIDGRIHGGVTMVNFVGLNFRGAVRHAEIAWNQIINEPNRSSVEDNINLSNTRGTSDSPIRIHDNYIQGAYPLDPRSSTFSGGGIIADSWYQLGMGDPVAVATAHVKIYNNQTVNLGNYNYAIAGGNNIEIHNNRAVNSATLPDGTPFAMSTVTFYGYDYYKKGVTFANAVHHNLTGLMGALAHQRNDSPYFPDGTVRAHDNATLPAGTVTREHEKQEYQRWLQKLQQSNITIGPNGTAPQTPIEEPAQPAPAPSAGVAGEGKITREYWDNISGSSISNIPLSKAPTSVSELSSFEAPSNVANNYGQRISGYITAPESGQYTFWIAGDDNAELYLSTSEDPAGKKRIAYVNGWTSSRQWNKYSSQQSAKITLEAGKRYYIEALHKEGGGGDNLAVAWQLPGGSKEMPIAGNRLSSAGSTSPSLEIETPIAKVTIGGSSTGKITREFWAEAHGGSVSDIPLSKTPTSVSELSSFEAPSNVANNYGQRISGYITAPESGQYTFWIAGDDNAELYLSTSEDPAGKKRIAYVNGYTAEREWGKYSSQQSAKITLEAGKRYYIEALHKEDGGGDNLAVAWQLPGGSKEMPIAGNRLSPLSNNLVSVSAMKAKGEAPFFENATAYPNPFNDMITLNLGNQEVELQEVVLLNQTGRVVYKAESLELANNSLEIDLSGVNLTPGLYILKYTDTAGSSKSIKVIKQ